MKLTIDINDTSENRVFFMMSLTLIVGFILGSLSVVVE